MTRHAFAYGAFCIDELPNQPQLAHCHSFFVHSNLRGQGFGHQLKHAQNETLHALGFNFATCTTAGDNTAQHSVLEQAGWKRLAEFRNTRTGGTTILWGWEVKA